MRTTETSFEEQRRRTLEGKQASVLTLSDWVLEECNKYDTIDEFLSMMKASCHKSTLIPIPSSDAIRKWRRGDFVKLPHLYFQAIASYRGLGESNQDILDWLHGVRLKSINPNPATQAQIDSCTEIQLLQTIAMATDRLILMARHRVL
jgi:hypothetical protein